MDFAYFATFADATGPNRYLFVASTVGAVAAIVLALGEERKGFDLHAAWARQRQPATLSRAG
jgi:hypothetical protein